MSSEVGDAIGNVKCNLNSSWSSPSSILVTGGFLGSSQIVLIFLS